MKENFEEKIDFRRRKISVDIQKVKKSKLGQYFTPYKVARFMSSLFTNVDKNVSLLDPGAGIGILSAAFISEWGDKIKNINLVLCELDTSLYSEIEFTLKSFKDVNYETILGDFLETFELLPSFTNVILNPPYKKINNSSQEKKTLRKHGIESVNLYTAFVTLSIIKLEQHGQLVAIIPRSFCNGVYYQPFREFLFKNAVIKQIHIFHSRTTVFSDEDILQENIIIHLEKNGTPSDIIISESSCENFDDLKQQSYPFNKIVTFDDPNLFIHIPIANDKKLPKERFNTSFEDLQINVSTGPIVDFRSKDFLHKEGIVGKEFVPLFYPAHFKNFKIDWPLDNFKKYNSIDCVVETEKQLYISGYYCVVKRFSSKEEKKRIVANVVDPDEFNNASGKLAFENHLNVFHNKKNGLSKTMAYGLMVYLNSSIVDEYFREFSGHTQVNVKDLKYIKYPPRHVVEKLGLWAIEFKEELNQNKVDEKIKSITV